MNMMTSLENIPLKTSSTSINDDSDDPLVKDILNEFHQEINNQPSPSSPQPPSQPNPSINNEYIINNPIIRKPPPPPQKSCSYYDEDLIRKSGIIIIIVAFFFSPIYISIIDKLPQSFSSILISYELYFKLFLIFISIYILMIKKLL